MSLAELPPNVASKVHRLAGARATVRLACTSKDLQTLASSEETWQGLRDDLWSSAPFSTANKKGLARGRIKPIKRPSAKTDGYKGAFRASVRDAITTDELTTRGVVTSVINADADWVEAFTNLNTIVQGSLGRSLEAVAVPETSADVDQRKALDDLILLTKSEEDE